LAEEVASSGGLLSEAVMDAAPMAGMFPARNRIISGLCRGVVLVEAAEKSGALITASHAGEQGRELFAVPGPVDSPASGGCLELIRKGAKLIRNVDDVLEDLAGIGGATGRAVGDAPKAAPLPPLPAPPELDGDGRRVWEFLDGRPRYVDEIARELRLSVPELSRVLTGLELKKVIRRLPGNQYERR
jgi:DNA processing protein